MKQLEDMIRSTFILAITEVHVYSDHNRILLSTFIPAITGGHVYSDHDRIQHSLSARFGGPGTPTFHEIAYFRYKNSRN